MTASVQASYVDMKRNESKSKAFRIDPTRTFTIRKAFVHESNRRFRLIKALIWDAIVTKDVLGLKEKKQKSISSVFHLADSGLQPKAFAFKTDPKKVESFMGWLNTELDAKILEVASPRKNVGNVAWANKYIDTAYKRGMKRAETELAKAGIPTSKLPDNVKWFAVEARFNLPIHADKVGLIYTRTYSDLKGITDTMSQEISRTLAQGMAEGRGPAYLARTLNNRIEQAGGDLAIVDPRGTVRMRAIDRARVLARTETIRAHHVGNINTYREAGIEGVMIQAEWSASGDELTCEDCMDLDGNVFPLDVIEGMIPYHPQCRCVAIPIVEGTEKFISRPEEEEFADVLPKIAPPVKVKPPILELPSTTPKIKIPTPKFKSFKNPNEIEEYAFEKFKATGTKIEQIQGIKAYAEEGGYESLNSALRKGKILDEAELTMKNALDSTMKPISENLQVYRGWGEGSVDWLQKLDVGDQFIDDAFVSTSLDKNVPKNLSEVGEFFGKVGEPWINSTIQLPKGVKGEYLEGWTGNVGEYEFLLARKTKFEVISTNHDKNIVLRVVEQGK